MPFPSFLFLFFIFFTPIFTSLKARFCISFIGLVMVMLQFCLHLSFRLSVSVLATKKA
jgi:hypothetical protein